MSENSSIKNDSNNFKEENSFNEKKNTINIERKYSINSSKSDSNFDNLNAEIKAYIENEADFSFSSNSNSESHDPQINIDYLLDSKYWQTNKDLQIENENQNEREICCTKNNLLLNEKEKESIKKYNSKNNYKRDSECSNKQSTQSNEDEESRIEHFHNISDIESNNSPSNSLSNNELNENEINFDKLSEKNNLENITNKEKDESTNNFDINNKSKNNIDNKSCKNGIGPNSLLNGFKFKNELDLVYPYEPFNYIQNQNTNAANPFFHPGSYLSQPFCSFNSNYNLPSPLNKRSLIPINNNTSNKISNNYSEKNDEEYFKKENKVNINGQNNKFINLSINDYNKKINQNQKEIIDLPLILNQNNNQNLPMNYNCSKLNLNIAYYPKIQNNNISNNKQFIDKISNSSNYLPNLSNKDNCSFLNNNLSEKKAKNNILFEEQKNSSNSIATNFNNMLYSNKLKMNYKNTLMNKNINNNILNKPNLKGEKQILNLDDIVSGKDTRTTVMIRNIPIKYTDEILNEALVEFHGKYDCLYMPYDYEKNGNKGYAFINFVNPLHILYFYEKFNGKKWVHFESSKICELNCAHFQGINEIQKHAKNFKDLKKSCFNSSKEDNMVIPSKYLLKLKKRFPKMQYNENKIKKILTIKSFE